MRKLASVQVVSALTPIPGADAIESARVMGWNVVVKKGDFKVGDKCVFFEIDSVLPSNPENEWAQFMQPRGFRVKTMKLRGSLSQGLALPMSILGVGGDSIVMGWNEGDDVTDALGVTKYEPVLPTSGPEAAGPFPSNVPKTDEMRLQSVMDVLDEIKDKPFYVTVKCDGTSSTFLKQDNELIVCSRNWALRDANNHYWNLARKYDLANVLPEGICIQGEICGPGIQKNRLGLKEVDLFVFSIYDTRAGKFLDWDRVVFFCHKHGLKTVPFDFEVDENELKNFPFTLENFLELAKGKYEGTQNTREGIVIRPAIECHSNVLGGRLSFKVISNDFLLKEEE